MTVLVTGASGRLGRAVTPRLRAQGLPVRPMSRRARPGWAVADLATGAGVPEAVAGTDAIVHLASAPLKTRQTDVEGTRRLVAAARDAGVRHVVYISINGADRVPLGYYRAKIAAEEVVRAGGVPYTVLRAAQFPSLVVALLSVTGRWGPVIVDRSLPLQPVHVDDVADRIAELLASGPTGETLEFAGPEVLSLEELARQWLAARGRRRAVWSVRMPGRIAAAVRAGGLTTTAVPTGRRTFRDYLAGR